MFSLLKHYVTIFHKPQIKWAFHVLVNVSRRPLFPNVKQCEQRSEVCLPTRLQATHTSWHPASTVNYNVQRVDNVLQMAQTYL